MEALAKKIERFYIFKAWHIDERPGAVNIAYIEGANADGTANKDAPDGWNDRRIVFMYDEDGQPYIALNTPCTTEPGVSATNSKKAAKLGGVARVMFGQFRVWKIGYHKGDPAHPALVQALPLNVHRDKNRDGKRTGDPVSAASGINQHGTRNGIKSTKVGNWSAGCLVGQWWSIHLNFMDLCRSDVNYLADPNYIFYTAIINGDEFAKFK